MCGYVRDRCEQSSIRYPGSATHGVRATAGEWPPEGSVVLSAPRAGRARRGSGVPVTGASRADRCRSGAAHNFRLSYRTTTYAVAPGRSLEAGPGARPRWSCSWSGAGVRLRVRDRESKFSVA